MMTPFRRIFRYALIISILIGTSFACRKKEDTIAIIHVRNTSNQSVSGAQVVLSVESTNGQTVNYCDTTTTNSSGEAKFNFNDLYQLGQAGVAILNIEAYKDGAEGHGIIKIEQEQTSEETVHLQD